MEFSLLAPDSRLRSPDSSHEHRLEDRDIDPGNRLLRLLSSRPRVKVTWLERSRLLGIAMRIGQHRQEGSSVVPGFGLVPIRHPDQFPQCERARVKADDPGQLPDQTVDVDAVFRAAAILRSSSSLSSRWFAVSIAIPSSRLSFTSALRNTVRRALGKKSTSSSSNAEVA